MVAMSEHPETNNIFILPRLQREAVTQLPVGIRQFPAVGSRLLYSLQAIRLALKLKPRIVYCGHAFMAPLALLVARLAGARLLSHVHGLEVWEPLPPTKRHALASSDLILCVSNFTAGKVVEVTGVNPKRCEVIYNTIDDRFTPGDRAAARAHFGLAQEAVVLSTVSRLDCGQRHKGHDRIIPLLAELSRDVPGLTYVIAGTGDDRDRLEGLAHDTGAADLVRFLGFVPDADLPDLYRASDLYVMPSHGEGFGIAFVEAMCCGTPALGLDIGGAGDALRDGELGRAVAKADFAHALRDAVTAAPADHADLAARTRATFGRSAFAERLARACGPLLP
ncbi:phosphatidylinositol alpha-1,6-mannosyltransferase [Roseinatronobacter thiooxidans]|uniref:Phosphatidylinositol alpha-1,6-mannosyltransferase n=2 Tax=Roseinatronobacter thiooxidans TaxID=121821 RepID=A0A2W7S5I1_9RHOB|nr:phosphatidylinositol alpha-1,6-mannosyltransferase [Roseinatronobacter thiooxidans]